MRVESFRAVGIPDCASLHPGYKLCFNMDAR